MADTTGMQDIRGLDIDKLAKGFAETAYIFKNDCLPVSMSGDSKRWYQKTAGTLTATAPSVTKNVAPLSHPATLEVSWTRNTAYVKKYFVEGFISTEDIKTADVDVLATTIRDLTLAITRDIDQDIWNVMSENQSPSTIQTFSTNSTGAGAWNSGAYSADIVKDLMHAKKMIQDYNYDPEGASLYLSPTDYQNVVAWLISGKGSSIPAFSSEKIKSGTVMQILGLNVKVSNNVTTSAAMVIVPERACTYAELTPITSATFDEQGIGTRVRVWAHGISYLTDPKAVVYITNTQN